MSGRVLVLGELALDAEGRRLAGRDASGRMLVACSFCDRATTGARCAPNAAIVCDDVCLRRYEARRWGMS